MIVKTLNRKKQKVPSLFLYLISSLDQKGKNHPLGIREIPQRAKKKKRKVLVKEEPEIEPMSLDLLFLPPR